MAHQVQLGPLGHLALPGNQEQQGPRDQPALVEEVMEEFLVPAVHPDRLALQALLAVVEAQVLVGQLVLRVQQVPQGRQALVGQPV